MVQKPFPSNGEKRKYGVLELLYLNIYGTILKTTSIDGSRYLLLHVNEANGCMKGFCLRSKSKSEDCIKSYIFKIQTQFGKMIKFVRHNGAREFATGSIKMFYEDQGIEQQLTVPYAHQTNGTAERAIRMIVTIGRRMLHHARLDKYFLRKQQLQQSTSRIACHQPRSKTRRCSRLCTIPSLVSSTCAFSDAKRTS